MDARVAAVSSGAAAAPLALFALACGEAGFAAFASDLTTTRDALAVGAGAAFAVPAAALFLSGCAARAEDVFAEAAERAGATFVVDSVALPVAFFPPVVFAIAILAPARKTNR
ncbi:RNA polymerase subunit sigma [Burkholderia pseudomallei]|uniref:RNA polymerase subunit sigma n=1 Tax=Burkholderia pseudomallei TaxID=28450 RepID=UPI001AAE3A90|nr:RNA polymerase subunit sigma [Burkholderia pseudomallei]